MKVLRYGRYFIYALLGLLLSILLLAAGVWVWGGSAMSLATVLSRVSAYLPADQSLEARDVTGSLRGGGHIGTLRWSMGALSVEASEVQLDWTLFPLLSGDFRVSQLTAESLRIDDRRPPKPPQNLEPPTDLRLPINVSIPFVIKTVEWVGPPALKATDLKGSYKFEGQRHLLDVSRVQISSGNYALQASVDGAAPMAVKASLDGAVSTLVPGSDKSLLVKAHAELTGLLANADAVLAFQAQLQPELSASQQRDPQATLTAQIQPWRAQPLNQAQAHWQALDLAALWPQAPHTQLSGEARVTPRGAAWDGSLLANNAESGPWDQQKLPLQSLNAQVVFDKGQWLLKKLEAKGAGGELEAHGEAVQAAGNETTPTTWKLTGTARHINPAALDTRLEALFLNGDLTAEQTQQGIRFTTELQPAPTQSARSSETLRGLRLKTVQASGLWRAPILQLDKFLVQTDDAKAAGKITVDTQTYATAGQLDMSVPGAQLNLAGNMASTDGEGTLQFKLSNAALASQWAARVPGAPASLKQLKLQGVADLAANWQGGWQKQGQTLRLQAKLQTAKLDVRQQDPKTTEPAASLRDTQLTLSGTLSALALQLQSSVSTPTHQFSIQSALQGGKQADGQWQASIDSAKVTARESATPGTWTAELDSKVSISLKQDATRRSLDVGAAALRLTGPAAGAAQVQWQASRWSRQSSDNNVSTAWSTRGSISKLPLAWVEFLGKTQLSNLGLRGDLVFGGQWEASNADALNLRVILERTSGDLQLLGDDNQTVALNAGLRDARLVLTANNENLGATLIWDSQSAGRLNATASTRLPIKDGLWTWAPDAPLAGKINAMLPPIAAWSLLAPPGWRLSGTLDADATLAGTLQTPLLQGSLKAKDIAVRSVLDGIDFSHGTLDAKLDGQRLILQEFTLQGAGAGQGAGKGDGQGGKLVMKGSVDWLPATNKPDATALSRVRVDMNAALTSLKLTSRVDRRLVMSGMLSARLTDTQLAIRGDLRTDEALIILPDDTAPKLGKDVVVRGRNEAGQPISEKPEVRASITPDVAVTLDFGKDFQLRGRGLSSRIAGQLALSSSAQTKDQLRLLGTVRTVRGTYKAYGQQLEIEKGELRFTGPYDNPTLNVLAVRPKLTQRVGVQINGTALSPVVRLYADPELPEAEKLAWLVLGRSPTAGGADAALLQQAAIALMGRNNSGSSVTLAERIGLDELSLGSTDNSATGGASGATVTLGKRLSKDFYIAYETGLSGAVGTLQVFYDFSRRFTLRAQTGSQSSVDFIYTHRYD